MKYLAILVELEDGASYPKVLDNVAQMEEVKDVIDWTTSDEDSEYILTTVS